MASSGDAEKVSFGADALPGYVFGPVGAPGVIMLQEWWGVNAQVRRSSARCASLAPSLPHSTQRQVKRHAKRLSEAGFRVLIPDIYKGGERGAREL